MFLNDFIEKSLDTSCPAFEDDALALEVLEIMENGRYDSLPVLHEGKLLAMVTVQDLLQARHMEESEAIPLRELPLVKPGNMVPEDNLFDVFAKIRLFPGSIVALSDREGKYLGCIRKSVLYEKAAEAYRLMDEGMTIELDLPANGLKLSEIVSVIEKNDATVMSFGMYHFPDMVAVFRVRTHDFFRLVTNMEKYGYSIRYSSPFFQDRDESLMEKAQEFIRFMDM
jgi:hypothetical protein